MMENNEQASSSSHNVAELPAPATNGPVERVTVASRPSKEPKKVAVGRAGAAARKAKAKQERLFEELRAAKELFRVLEERNGIPPKDASNTREHVAAVVPKERNNQIYELDSMDIAFAMATKDALIKQGIIPADFLK